MRSSLSRLVAPIAALHIAIGVAFGASSSPAHAQSNSAPFSASQPLASHDWPSVPLAELKAGLDQLDQFAILEAIHVGLSDAPDGSTYMWRRNNGKIAGSVRPTASFRDAYGKVCRFLVFQLHLGEHMRQIEGIACRQNDKSWLLEG